QGGAAAATHVEAPAIDREKGDESDNTAEGGEESGKGKKPARAAPKKKKPPGSQLLPPMKVGDKPKLERIDPEEHFTQPPPRYTEASLVKKLEREGIGRPSTYSAILSKIQDV